MTTTGHAVAILDAMAMAIGTATAQAQTEIVLHGFNWAEGKYPAASVIRDWAGNLYGTASRAAGATASCSSSSLTGEKSCIVRKRLSRQSTPSMGEDRLVGARID
jgi:hypothetical protein